MPSFEIKNSLLLPILQSNFGHEKDLQTLIEKNLGAVFNCRFVATEFSTGAVHAGRIDTLALSEDNNPVIIEYKKVESSELITQSLFYLSWIHDHKGDFNIAVQKSLGHDITVDWSDVRVICIAPNYRKYDLHAVQVMGANIELWKYRLYQNSTFHLEEVFHSSGSHAGSVSETGKVSSGKTSATSKASGIYTFDQHFVGKPKAIRDLAEELRDFVMNLDTSIEESPKKMYVAYKTSQNIICIEMRQKKILAYLKLNPTHFTSLPLNGRDVRGTGHYGTGDVELTITSSEDIEIAKEFIVKAYEAVGG